MRTLELLAAPSSLGLTRASGREPRVDLLPEALLGAGLGRRLGVELGTVVRPGRFIPGRDPETQVLNPHGVADMSRRLADAVQAVHRAGRFSLVLGGDCSILLGCLLGLKRGGGRYGLVFLDGHTDFWPPHVSSTGGVAGMDLWFATGRPPALLGNLEGLGPLVRDEDVALLGVRHPEDWQGAGVERARDTAMMLLDLDALRREGVEAVAERTLARMRGAGVDGFWVHLDADVLDDAVMHAVDSPQPGGMMLQELSTLLQRLVASGLAVGLDVTIYDPSLDPDRSQAQGLADALVRGLGALAPGR